MKAIRKLYIETYGCQMNVADSDVVVAIMKKSNYTLVHNAEEADIILVNTCSVRENAEIRVRGRLNAFRPLKNKNPDLIVGIIGCMAERLKDKLFEEEEIVDIIAGPDTYRGLPVLLDQAQEVKHAINVDLSDSETYPDIIPYRTENKLSAFISIMRGCNNYCSYCIVPYVRGKERSRDHRSIIGEVESLADKGYKEVVLLGQNVNSYMWNDTDRVTFSKLLEMVAKTSPEMRVRFTTSHPKDMPDGTLQVIAKYDNICKHIHLPLQSGSTRILELMNRKYTREMYMDRIMAIKEIIPGCGITTDVLAGFCTETVEDQKQTLSLMEWAGFDFAFMFKYSERPGTNAAKTMNDDVPEDVKIKRLEEIIDLQKRLSAKSNKRDVNKIFEVLVERVSKKSKEQLSGRTSQNKVIVFPKEDHKPGDIVNIKVTDFTSATLIGRQ